MISTRNNLKGPSVPADIASRFSAQGGSDQTKPDVAKVLQIYPWWLYKPPTAQDISVIAQNSFIAAGTATLAAVATVLDQNTMAIIRGIDCYVNSMTPSTVVSFSFLVNGTPVPGYGTINIFPRTAASITQSFDTFIYCPAGSTISMQVTNTDGGTYLVGAGYQGWSVPVNIDSILGVNGGVYTGVG